MPVKRNNPCPCNSGKKYKKCCGRMSTIEQRQSEQSDYQEQWDGISDLVAACGGDFSWEDPRDSYFVHPLRVMAGVVIGVSVAIVVLGAM